MLQRRVVREHGAPQRIVSDRDTRMDSAHFKEWCLERGIKHHMSTAYHPQSDGQTERVNRVL